MKRLTLRTSLSLAIDLALVVLCIFHIPAVINRAEAPVAVREIEGKVCITDILDASRCTNVRAGDELALWNGIPVPAPESVEFLSESSPVGTRIPLTLVRDGSRIDAAVTLVSAYTPSYVVLVCFIALATFCLGVFVLISRQGNLVASTLHWALVMMAVAVVTSYEGTTPSNPMPLVSSLLFFLSYAGTGIAFLLFTTLFPRVKPGSWGLKIMLVFAPAMVILAFMISYHTRALLSGSVEAFTAYSRWFSAFHVLLFVYVVVAIFSFIHSYVTAVSSDERRKLKWILWGITLAPLPFLVLVVVPRQFNFVPLVPEEYTLLILLIIPATFVVSFMRHRLMDIELVIRRTTAYAIVVGVLLAGYVVVITVVASSVGRVTASVTATVIVALCFEPVLRRVQHVVDSRFFRVQYDFRKAEQRFVEQIKESLTVAQLGDTLVREVQAILPVERIGFFLVREPGSHLRLIAHQGFDLLTRHAPRFEVEKLRTSLHLPVALTDRLEPGIPHEPADAEVFHRWGLSLVLTMLSQENTTLGFLALGRKKSALRFTIEDVDLLKNACTQAGLTVERVLLQEKLFAEHQERERLSEINQLKTDFVSYVSHELKTPLTSIKMFAEMLRSRPFRPGEKEIGYLRIIEGETDRLDRMVTTILDSARIDSGIKIYELKEIDLLDAVKTAVAIMQYQLDKQGFRVTWSVKPGRPGHRGSCKALLINGDHDAVVLAVTNLIGNAIKYSHRNKHVKVSLKRIEGFAVCTVQDRGTGISPAALPHLFDKFYRVPSTGKIVQGFGLGLPLVQNIMDAHQGRVDVVSTPGKGSAFSLSFPLVNSTTQS